jgi:uncharacterized membrane protein
LGQIFALATAVTWAGAVVLFKRTGEAMAPLQLNVFKNLSAAGLMVLTLVCTHEGFWPAPRAADFWLVLLSGALGLGLADLLFFRSLNLIGAGRMAIVDAIYSPAVIAIAFLFLGERLSRRDSVGAALVASAVLLTVNREPNEKKSRGEIVFGAALGALAVVLIGIAIAMVKPLLHSYSVLWVAAARIIGGAATTLVALMPFSAGRSAILCAVRPTSSWKFAVPAVFLGTYVSLILWVAGFKYADAGIAAILNQTSTLFIVVLAWLFLREPMTLRLFLAVALATAGSLLVLW